MENLSQEDIDALLGNLSAGNFELESPKNNDVLLAERVKASKSLNTSLARLDYAREHLSFEETGFRRKDVHFYAHKLWRLNNPFKAELLDDLKRKLGTA